MRVLKILVYTSFIVLFLFILAYLELSGIIYHNDFNARTYKIHGIDISHHQDRINWNLVDKKYKFVLMKATEGQDFTDSDFYYNWTKASSNGFYVGAYHFLTITSLGREQAKHYISVVPKLANSFPPILDLEISTKYNKKQVLKQLKDYIDIVERYYGKKIIIYLNDKVYKAYIKGEFLKNPIWIRNVRKTPSLLENDRWIIWQYSNRGRVKGISGFTDKDVLRYDDINKYINKD